MAVSHEIICEAITQSRFHLSQKRGYDVYPESHACDFIVQGALDILDGHINAKDLQFELPDGTTHHAIRIIDETSRVFDGQFKQFIPPESRETLPDILVIDATQPQEHIQSMLESMGMQPYVAECYAFAVGQ